MQGFSLTRANTRILATTPCIQRSAVQCRAPLSNIKCFDCPLCRQICLSECQFLVDLLVFQKLNIQILFLSGRQPRQWTVNQGNGDFHFENREWNESLCTLQWSVVAVTRKQQLDPELVSFLISRPRKLDPHQPRYLRALAVSVRLVLCCNLKAVWVFMENVGFSEEVSDGAPLRFDAQISMAGGATGKQFQFFYLTTQVLNTIAIDHQHNAFCLFIDACKII